jgi:hypothetical protein
MDANRVVLDEGVVPEKVQPHARLEPEVQQSGSSAVVTNQPVGRRIAYSLRAYKGAAATRGIQSALSAGVEGAGPRPS